MADDPRVQQLLDELLVAHTTAVLHARGRADEAIDPFQQALRFGHGS
jgi:hypothetical protein